MNLDTVILSDPLVIGLENRAFREGVLEEDDFTLIEHMRPRAASPTLAELQALDILCLYDNVVSEVKRFRLDGLNAVAGDIVIQARPDLVREMGLQFNVASRRSQQIDPTFLSRHAEYQAVREQAAAEAKALLCRDIGWHLQNARSCFESEAPRWREARLFDRKLPHSSVSLFLRRHIVWLVDEFDAWFRGGVYNQDLEADWLPETGTTSEVDAQFKFFCQSDRFDAYFRHLQEAYASLYENSFIGRVTGHELAYGRAPVGQATQVRGLDVPALSRVIHVNLADVAEYFPLPRTVEEAFEMRGDRRLQVFRGVLNAWLCSVGSDLALEAKLRRELSLASRDLKRLARWRTLKQHPVYFGVKAVAGWIPVADKVVNLFDLVDYFAERHVRQRKSWVVTPHGMMH